MSFRRAYITTSVILTIFVLGFLLGYWGYDYFNEKNSEFPITLQAYQIIRDHGLKDLPPAPDIEYGMIRGLLQAYDDPFTIFVEPVQHELDSDTLEGSFGGIGVRLSRDPTGNMLIYPFPDGPAKTSGLLDGDRLLFIDGIEINQETTFDTAQALIRGPISTKVQVTIGRPPDYSPKEYTLERFEISLPSVTWHIDYENPEIGVVEVNVIAASTVDEIEDAVQDLSDQGVKYYIFDLRDNFGGLLTGGVDIARLFLHDGIIVEQRFRDSDVEVYKVNRSGSLVDIPMVVLVNQHTASAAEIVVGSLKAHGRSKIIGTPTYGKYSVQLVFELDDSSSLRVTSAEWWIPGLGQLDNVVGILPDLEVSPEFDDHGVDMAIKAAREVLMENFK